jgi:hypothetical protein
MEMNITLKMINTADYKKLVDIIDYLEANYNKIPNAKYLLKVAANTVQDKYVEPECSQIKRLYIKTKDMSEPFRYDSGQGLCSDAQTLGEPFHQYVEEIFKDLDTFYVELYNNNNNYYDGNLPTAEERRYSEEERRFLHRIRREPEEERNIDEYREPEEEKKEPDIVDLNVDYKKPFDERLKEYDEQLKDLIDAVKKNNNSEAIKALNEKLDRTSKELKEYIDNKINRVDSKIEQVRSGNTNLIEPIEVEMNKPHFDRFRKYMFELGVPFTAEMEGKTYKLTFQPKTEEEKEKVNKTLDKAAKEYQKSIEKARFTRGGGGLSEAEEHILDKLCENYMLESHMKTCGVSRNGALKTLARRIYEFAQSNDIDWQELNLDIDMFAKDNQIYTAEQADEAFQNFVLQNGGYKGSNPEYDNECPMGALADAIFDFDVFSFMKRSNIPLSDRDKERLNNVIDTLKNCKYINGEPYYPNHLDSLRTEAEGFYATEYGIDYDYNTLLKMELEKRGIKYS